MGKCLTLFAMTFIVSWATTSSADEPFALHGAFSEMYAQTMYGSTHPANIESQAILQASGDLTKNVSFRVSGRFKYDGALDEKYYSINAASDERLQAQWRDTYLDYSKGPFDVRLGKQQIVWGDAVGAFVADIVNPKDYRRNILDDFDQIRIPEWGLDVEYSIDKFHAEAFVIPMPEFDLYGVEGSQFAASLPVPSGINFTTVDPKKPSGFDDVKAGARVSYLIGGFDLGAFFVHSFTHSPVSFRTIGGGGDYVFDPRYKSLNSIGGSFSKKVGETVISGEFVFNKDNYFSILDDTDADGVAQSDDLSYVIGLNQTFFQDINVGVQYFQTVVFDYQNSFMNQRRVANSASFQISRDFINHKLEAEFLVIASLDSPDFLYRPSLKYNISSNWQLKLGMDIFAGHGTNPFGYYRSQSRYYIVLVYKF